MTKVSVVIPTYNCAVYIAKAIESALNQTSQNIEIVIVDDGSTDNTREVVRNYEDKYSIKYIYQENKGVAEARNRGILAAKGEYIAYVDADDELDEQMITKCLQRIENDNTEWCVTDILRIESYGNGIKKEIFKTDLPKNLEYGILEHDFSRRSPFFRKKTLVDIGLYDKTLLTREDWDMNIRLIRGGIRFSYVPEPVYIYKIRKSGLMKSAKKKSYDSTLRLLKKHHKNLADEGSKDIAKIYAQNLWRLAKAYLSETNDVKSFMFCVAESMRYDFSLKRLFHPFYFHLIKRFLQSSN
jgi:glycosyltransferase involved in cell wall biosynthesis